MVSAESVEQQLKKVNFNLHGWGRSEAKELPHILMPEEEIYEVVNGMYEGGFALLVATNLRMLLIDKKPMNYLTVEDLRFDMVSEIDYAHRMLGARISVSTGSKNLKFTSYNQQRLRKLITHVQHYMAEAKRKSNDHQEDQKQHLEQINQQLQTYLVAQHNEQQALRNNFRSSQGVAPQTPITRPDPQLADYLYAQSLLSQNQATKDQADMQTLQMAGSALTPAAPRHVGLNSQQASQELYAEGVQEIFGKRQQHSAATSVAQTVASVHKPILSGGLLSFEINPLKVAYSKLPMALRNRKFGRPSFHAHSEAEVVNPQPVAP